MRRVLLFASAIIICLAFCSTINAGKPVYKKKHIVKPKSVAKCVTAKPKIIRAVKTKSVKLKIEKTIVTKEIVQSKTELVEQVPADSGTNNGFTSLIVDATGFKMTKSMTAKLFRKDGSEVWGTLSKLTDEQYSILEDRGMVGFVATLDEAKANSRAGKNPLIIKAEGCIGSNQSADPVVSDADADQLLSENSKYKFLDNFNVIFVRNETPITANDSSPDITRENSEDLQQ